MIIYVVNIRATCCNFQPEAQITKKTYPEKMHVFPKKNSALFQDECWPIVKRTIKKFLYSGMIADLPSEFSKPKHEIKNFTPIFTKRSSLYLPNPEKKKVF